MIMAICTSICMQGASQVCNGKHIVVGYKYTDDAGRKYDVKMVGSEYLLSVDDSTLQVRGYCMLDSSDMETLRKQLSETSLDNKPLDFRKKVDASNAKTWKVRIWKSDGNEDDDKWIYHRGYFDGSAADDAEGMRRCMGILETIHRLLLQKLQWYQTKYGSQVIACMEHSEYGYMYMMVGENGERISPREDFWYFNYGDHAVVEKKSVQAKTTHKRRVISEAVGETIGETLKVKQYVKPREDIRVLDAPSSVYTFYFFDGRCVSFNRNYMERYEGTWIVENPWQVEKLLKIED